VAVGNLSPELEGPVQLELAKTVEQLPVIHGPDEIATHWGKGSKAPLIKVQPRLVVEVAADAALQVGHFRHPLRFHRLRPDCVQKTSRQFRIRVRTDKSFTSP
jgi:ATP-dependent DNA ligase